MKVEGLGGEGEATWDLLVDLGSGGLREDLGGLRLLGLGFRAPAQNTPPEYVHHGNDQEQYQEQQQKSIMLQARGRVQGLWSRVQS